MSEYVKDPLNPTDAELSAAISRSLGSGTLVDAGAWMARELGTQHGSEDTAARTRQRSGTWTTPAAGTS